MSSVDAKQILRRWVDSVNAAGIDEVAALYVEGCILLPTFSPDVLCSRSQIKDYFRKYGAQVGLRVVVDEGSVAARALGGDCHVLTGRYTFHIGAGDAAVACPAQFTFIVDLRNEQILHHHSSRLPQET